jgi:hypothetical protein
MQQQPTRGNRKLITEENEFEGVFYFPTPNKFSATIGYGKRATIIGYFDTLDEALIARRKAQKEKEKAA